MQEKIWNEFIDNAIFQSYNDYQKTREAILWGERSNQIDEMLSTNLNITQKIMVDEIISEIKTQNQHYIDNLYKRSMENCICILKNLGVI